MKPMMPKTKIAATVEVFREYGEPRDLSLTEARGQRFALAVSASQKNGFKRNHTTGGCSVSIGIK